MPIWPQLVVAILINVASHLLSPKPTRANPAAAEDVEVPKLPYGSPRGVLQGTVEIKGAGHVWHGDVSAKAIKSKGGK